MSTIAYRCPGCGAPLAYGADSGKLECSACGSRYELDALEAILESQDAGGIQFDLPQESFNEEEAAQMRSYICQSCGAELMTEETTTATACPYCGSPTVLPERIDAGVKPELVIPFTVSKEQAQKLFEEYFKGKKLLPNVFLNTRNRIAEMRMLYVPYWLFDCTAGGSAIYDAQKRHIRREGDWEVTYTEHFVVSRAGQMDFDSIPVDGSVKLRNEITESLEPYDLSAAVPFEPAVLAGAMADHADAQAQECLSRATERVEKSMEQALRSTVAGYTSVTARHKNFHAQEGKVTPVLMPVWLITTEKEGTTYTFAINGQTGKLTCDVPMDGKKAFAWGGGVFAGVAGIAMLILWLMEQLASGTILMACIAALIAALIVVGALRGQLKQAVHQSAAANYVVDNSFDLALRYDRFLYETTKRRKIERNDEKKG